ncbi:hypothetical protein C8Q79DRAFT_1002663 [Trametes meyenii]|nr:hypothetical protein C8Q79DRAFT_1002663 [Trametes meyenii]
MSGLDKYKVPREQVDVEALAQELARYNQICAEDTEALDYDHAARDRIMADLYANPDCKPSAFPHDTVGGADEPLEKYDAYLAQVNAAIADLTPPKSLEDRVARNHLAFAALMVFIKYKVEYALLDYNDLGTKVMQRFSELTRLWMDNEYPRLFPDRAAKRKQNSAVSTPPTRGNPLTPPSTRHSGRPKAIPVGEVAQYLANPSTMLGKRFLHTPPRGEEQDYKGEWTMESYSTRMREGRVDHEFQVVLEAMDGASLPMDREEVEFLLKYSTLVV